MHNQRSSVTPAQTDGHSGQSWYRAFAMTLLLATVTGCTSVVTAPDEPAEPVPLPPEQTERGNLPRPERPAEPAPVVTTPRGAVTAAQVAAGMANPPTCGYAGSTADVQRKPAREWSVADACLQMLKDYEGFRADAHFGPAGNRLIGYGHTIKADEQLGSISRDKAHALLIEDVAQKASSVADFITVPVSRNEFSALVCLAYNVGEGKLAGDSTIRQLNKGNYRAAADEMTTIRRANGQINRQLVERRQAECSLFLTP